MAKSKKAKKSKASVKVRDLSPKKNATGGRKAGKGQEDYLIVKMNDILITG